MLDVCTTPLSLFSILPARVGLLLRSHSLAPPPFSSSYILQLHLVVAGREGDRESSADKVMVRNVEDRLAQLEVNGNSIGGTGRSTDNYIYIQPQSVGMESSVPVATSEQWQTEILDDPKVCILSTERAKCANVVEESC